MKRRELTAIEAEQRKKLAERLRGRKRPADYEPPGTPYLRED